VLRSQTIDTGALAIPATFVKTAHLVVPGEADQWMSRLDTHSPPPQGPLLVLEGYAGETVVFEIVAESFSSVRGELALVLPGLTSSGARGQQSPTASPPAPGSTPRMERYDLAKWSDAQRRALTSQLVQHGVPHGWDRDTLNVAASDKTLVDTITAEVGTPTGRTVRAAPTKATGGPNRRSAGAPMSERIDVLERLVALRDAGALTPEEFEAARTAAARQLVDGQ